MSLRTLNRLSVLLVGGSESQCLGLKAALGVRGVRRVATAAGAVQAMEILSWESMDVVLADWATLSAGEGRLLEWIRQSPASWRDVPVIVLTAHPDASTVSAIRQAGADAVLATPVDPAVLARRIVTVRRGSPGAKPQPRVRPFRASQSWLVRTAPTATSAAHRPPGRTRLTIILERLAGLVREKVRSPAAMRILVNELQAAAAGKPVVEELARSLARCIHCVSPSTPGYAGAIEAHVAALRWGLVRIAASPVDRSLVASLSAGVEAMIDQQWPQAMLNGAADHADERRLVASS